MLSFDAAFVDVAAEMTAEQHEISRSTPNYRFDVCAAPAPPPKDEPVESAARQELQGAISDAENPGRALSPAGDVNDATRHVG